MSSDLEPLDKAKEAVEEAKERKHMAPVSLTIAILAVFVAIVSLLGHRAHTEEILMQNRATDAWGYYQAKNISHSTLEGMDQALDALGNTNAERAQEVHKHFRDEIDKYGKQREGLKAKADEFEAEVKLASRRADRFDLGEVFLEIALVITSITLLTDNRKYWYCGIILAVVGVVAAGSGLLVH